MDTNNNNETINFKTAFSYFSSFEYKEEQEIIENELRTNKKKNKSGLSPIQIKLLEEIGINDESMKRRKKKKKKV